MLSTGTDGGLGKSHGEVRQRSGGPNWKFRGGAHRRDRPNHTMGSALRTRNSEWPLSVEPRCPWLILWAVSPLLCVCFG